MKSVERKKNVNIWYAQNMQGHSTGSKIDCRWLEWKMMKNGQKYVTNRRTNPNSRSSWINWMNEWMCQTWQNLYRDPNRPFRKYSTLNSWVSLNLANIKKKSPYHLHSKSPYHHYQTHKKKLSVSCLYIISSTRPKWAWTCKCIWLLMDLNKDLIPFRCY